MKRATHDYRRRGWGHDYVWRPKNDGLEGNISGWGRGISKGDYILLDNGADGSRYQFTQITYCLDPSDMFHGELKFAPRSSAMKKREASKVGQQ